MLASTRPLSLRLAAAAALAVPSLAQTEVVYAVDQPPGILHGWGLTIAPLHDLDGDGVAEVAVGASDHGGGAVASVHDGATGAHLFDTVAPFGPLFYGQALTSVSDAAGDGVADVVLVGARSGAHNSTDGWFGVYSGVDGALLRSFTPPAGMTLLRAPCLALDDVDGDGREDLLCLVQSTSPGGIARPQLFSSLTGAPLHAPGVAPSTGFVVSEFTAVDDHDGDGRRDFAIVVFALGQRRIDLRSGATGALLARLAPRAAQQVTNNGEPLVSVADLDGDGLRDLALGGVFAGFVEIFSTHDGASLASWDCATPGTACFGSRLIEAGDLDGDDHPDLIALETNIGGTNTLALFGLSPVTGDVLFVQPLPSVIGGYSGADRIAALPGVDPLGLPTFALFDDAARALTVRRHAPALGVSVCASTPNSSGAAATIRALGLASAASDRLVLEVRDAPVQTPALFFFADAALQQPLGPGFLCLGGASLGRLPVGLTDTAGTYGLRVDVPASSLTVGVEWTFQAFFRDAGPAGLQTSDAVTLTLLP